MALAMAEKAPPASHKIKAASDAEATDSVVWTKNWHEISEISHKCKLFLFRTKIPDKIQSFVLGFGVSKACRPVMQERMGPSLKSPGLQRMRKSLNHENDHCA